MKIAQMGSIIDDIIDNVLSGVFEKISKMAKGFIAIIPQMMYFIFSGICSLLDAMQLVLRKLAGLDVYYVDGVAKSGDIVSEIINGIFGINTGYSALTVVFWSLIIFSVLLLIITTIVAIIKSQYNTEKAKPPMGIVGGAIKSLFTIAVTPVVMIFGMYISGIFLRTVDKITNPASVTQTSTLFMNEAEMGIVQGTLANGEKTYSSYDVFGASEWSSGITFSSVIFKSAGYSANRVRLGQYTPSNSPWNSNWDSFGLFYSDTTGDALVEQVANQIDFAFANNIRVASDFVKTIDITGEEAVFAIGSSLTNPVSAVFSAGTIKVSHFSKFNVGLVWYYYDLWSFNFFIGFFGAIICFTLFANIIFGLLNRLFNCVILAMIYSPLVAISPLDGGNAYKNWGSEFLKTFLGVYGSIVGMNIGLILIEFLQGISFFNIAILDSIFNILLIIATLTLIKNLISIFSQMVGGKDLNQEGEGLKTDAIQTVMKGAKATLGVLDAGSAVLGYARTGGVLGKTVSTAGRRVKNRWIGSKAYGSLKRTGMKVKNSFSSVGNKIKGISENAHKKVGSMLHSAGQTRVAKAVVKMSSGVKKTTQKAGQIFKYVVFGDEGDLFSGGSTNTVSPISEQQNVGQRGEKYAPKIKDNSKPKRKPGSAILKGFLDLSGATLGVADSILGVSGTFKEADKSIGLADSFKGSLQNFFQNIGQEAVVARAKAGESKLSTDKQKEEKEERVSGNNYDARKLDEIRKINELLNDITKNSNNQN